MCPPPTTHTSMLHGFMPQAQRIRGNRTAPPTSLLLFLLLLPLRASGLGLCVFSPCVCVCQVIFSTDCKPFQDWQSILVFLTAEMVGHKVCVHACVSMQRCNSISLPRPGVLCACVTGPHHAHRKRLHTRGAGTRIPYTDTHIGTSHRRPPSHPLHAHPSSHAPPNTHRRSVRRFTPS